MSSGRQIIDDMAASGNAGEGDSLSNTLKYALKKKFQTNDKSGFSVNFEQFFGFFSELVNPIELILFSLA